MGTLVVDLTLPCVVLVVLYDPGQPEVGHLDGVVLPDQHVPGRQVTVDVVLPLQVRHPASNL